MTRKQVIAELLDFQLKEVQSDKHTLAQFLADVLEYGMHGLYSLTDGELAHEYKQAFGESITIGAKE